MKVWIHIEGVQEGPYELDNLPLDRMSPDTPVWYEGLPDWIAAGEAPLVAPLFNPQMATVEVQPAASPILGAYAEQAKYERCPSTYLIWSIIMAVVCCNPLAILAIITGAVVRSKFRNDDMAGAEKWSEVTAWLVMICIVTSIMLMPFVMLSNFS